MLVGPTGLGVAVSVPVGDKESLCGGVEGVFNARPQFIHPPGETIVHRRQEVDEDAQKAYHGDGDHKDGQIALAHGRDYTP